MSQRFESQIIGSQSEELFLQCWLAPDAVGDILVTHGLAEHSDCYNDFAQRLNEKRYNVWAWDLPGHGRSSGKRGYIQSFQFFMDDLSRVIGYLRQQKKIKMQDLILFGHSMGGLITFLQTSQTKTQAPRAIVLSAPAFGLALEVPKIKSWASKILMDWAPMVTLSNEIDYSKLVRDEDLIKQYENDHLRHDKVSAPIFLGMLEGFEAASNLASELHIPVLMILGGQDHITDSMAAEEVFKKIPSQHKKLFISPKSYHEVFNDIDKDEAFECLFQFLESVS